MSVRLLTSTVATLASPSSEVVGTDPAVTFSEYQVVGIKYQAVILTGNLDTCYFRLATNYFFATFFLPATVLRLPLRVRLLVRVRCPRSGSPLRWRNPR